MFSLVRRTIAALVAQFHARGTDKFVLVDLFQRQKGRRSKAKGTEPEPYFVEELKSQRLEAIVKTLIFTVFHTDFGHPDGLMVGVWDQEKEELARSYSLEEISKLTGMTRPSQRYEGKVRSSCRQDRAIRDLRKGSAGYLHRHQARLYHEDGSHEGLISSTKQSKKLYRVLDRADPGLYAAMEKERKRQKQERFDRFTQRRRTRQEQEQRQRQAQEVTASPVGGVVAAAARRELVSSQPQGVEAADMPGYVFILGEVREQHPDWPGDQVREEARRRVYERHKPPDRA